MSYIEEKIYSKAFEDGINYAIEKMFSEDELSPLTDQEMNLIKNKNGRLLGLLGTGGGGNVGYLIGRKQARKKIKEGASDEDVRKAAMKGSLIGSIAPTAGAVAIGYARSRRNPEAVKISLGKTALSVVRGAASSVVGSRMNANEMIDRRKTLKNFENKKKKQEE